MAADLWNLHLWLYDLQSRKFLPNRVFAATRVKRSKATIVYNSNLTSTFRSVLQLIHDIELNPGPNNYSINGARTSKNNVSIAHLNARSLKGREHYMLIKETILTNKFDVFTVFETWQDRSVTNLEVEVLGYDFYRVDRENKEGGGVCAYVLRTYKTEVLSEISFISLSRFHQLWLKIQVRNLKSIVVCTTYRPPDASLSCFHSDLTSSFISASMFAFPIHIMGDLNYNLLKSNNQDAIAFTDFSRSFNLTQLIHTPTRVTDASKSLLDVILASEIKQVQKAEVMESSISDHDIVYVALRFKKARTLSVLITTRSFKNYNRETF